LRWKEVIKTWTKERNIKRSKNNKLSPWPQMSPWREWTWPEPLFFKTKCCHGGKWLPGTMFLKIRCHHSNHCSAWRGKAVKASGWWRGRNPLTKKGDVAITTDGLPGVMCKLCSKYKSPFPSFQTGDYYIFRERIGRNFTVFIEQECLSVDSSRFFEKSSSWHGFSTFLPLL